MPPPKDPIKREEYCKNMSKIMSGKNHPGYGTHRSELTRKRIGDAQTGEKHHMFGKHHPQSTREKMSKSHKGKGTGKDNPMFGKHHSPDHRKELSIKMSGKNNPMFGKHHTPEALLQISKTSTGRYYSPESRKKMSISKTGEKHPHYGKKFSEKIKLHMSIGRSGEKSYRWKGGTSFLPYCFKFNNRRRRSVREFFGNMCICCGKHANENITKTGRQIELSVHHIDHDKEQGCNGNPFNLVPLCLSDHAKEQIYEQEYKDYINKTLKNGFEWGIWSKEQYQIEIMYPETGEA